MSVAHQRVAQRGRQQRERAVLSLHARVIRETTQTESASPTTRVIAAARACGCHHAAPAPACPKLRDETVCTVPGWASVRPHVKAAPQPPTGP